MRRITAKLVLAIAGLACCGAVHAHHSMSMFDLHKSIWLKGTVVGYEPVNPHVRLTLEQKTQDGHVQRWLVEGPDLNRLHRMGVGGDFLKPGDVIEICGFPFKQEYAQPSRAAPGDLPRPAMHVHMVVMPDGHRRLFGPYGKLDNCIRSGDTARSWVDFLDTDPLALQAWCKGQTLVSVPSTAPRELVQEINERIASQCQ